MAPPHYLLVALIVLLDIGVFLSSAQNTQRFNQLVSQRGHIELPLELPNTKTFTLTTGDSAASVTAQLADARCEFQYEVIPCSEISSLLKKDVPPADNAPETGKEKKSFEYYLDDLLKRGPCLEKSHEDWRYKVCLWSDVMQFYRDGSSSIQLGRYSSEESKDDKMVFSGGESCQQKPRKTIVSLFCGDTDGITEISEFPMCVYHVSVTFRSLCGEGSPFKRFSASVSSKPQRKEKAEDIFMLQIEKSSSEDSYGCSVMLTQMGARTLQTPTICFKTFALTVSSSSSSSSEVTSKAWSMSSWTARKPNRKDFAEGEIGVSSASDNTKRATGIKSSSQFQPSSIEFLRIMASPPATRTHNDKQAP